MKDDNMIDDTLMFKPGSKIKVGISGFKKNVKKDNTLDEKMQKKLSEVGPIAENVLQEMGYEESSHPPHAGEDGKTGTGDTT